MVNLDHLVAMGVYGGQEGWDNPSIRSCLAFGKEVLTVDGGGDGGRISCRLSCPRLGGCEGGKERKKALLGRHKILGNLGRCWYLSAGLGDFQQE